MGSNIRVTVSIVNWNTKDSLLACLDSLFRDSSAEGDTEIIVVDNASSDGSADAVASLYPSVRLVRNTRNIGFGCAHNLAIKAAKGSIVFFLNSDTLVAGNTVQAVIGEFSRDPAIGAVGCRCLSSDGAVQATFRDLPTFRAYLYSDTVLRLFGLFKSANRRYRNPNYDYDKRQYVGMVVGAAFAVRKAILDEIGGYDPWFFLYFEEADLCKRVIEAGYRIVYSPLPIVTHVGGVSCSQNATFCRAVKIQSLMYYLRKHNTRFRFGLFVTVFWPLFLSKVVLSVTKNIAFITLHTVFLRNTERAAVRKRRLKEQIRFLGLSFSRCQLQG